VEAREFFVDHWSLIYSGQLAEVDHAKIEGAQAVLSHARSVGVVDDYEKSRAQFVRPEQPALPAVTSWPRSVEEDVADRLRSSEPFVRAQSDIGRLAEQVWKEPKAVLTSLLDDLRTDPSRFESRLSQIAATPQGAGDLLGTRSLLGRNDAERARALQAARPIASELGYLRDRINLLRQSYGKEEADFRNRMRVPLEGLSPAATGLIDRIGLEGAAATKGVRSADEKLAVAEVKQFVSAFASRFGRSDGAGLRQDLIDRVQTGPGTKDVTEIAKTYSAAQKAISAIETAERASAIETGMTRSRKQSRWLEI